MGNKIKKISAITTEIALLIALIIVTATGAGCDANMLVTMKSVGIAAIISFFVLIFAASFGNGRCTYFHIFLCLCFLFSFGQCITTLFSGAVDYTRLLSVGCGKLSASDVYFSSFYVLRAIVCLTIGYTAVYKKRERAQKGSKVSAYALAERGKEHSFRLFNTLGWALLIVSAVPTFWMLLRDISVLKSGGYLDTLQTNGGVEKVCNIIQGFFPAALIIIFLTEDGGIKKCVAFAAFLFYIILQLYGGSRINVFRFAVLAATIYLVKAKRIRAAHVLYFAIAILFAGFVFSFVSSYRLHASEISGVGDLLNIFTAQFGSENIFYKVFFEAGNTQIINTVVYAYCPSTVGYCYGQSVLKMFFSIIPNVGIYEVNPTTMTTDAVFSHFFTDACGLGSSVFAEAFWNFGEYGAYVYLTGFGALLAYLLRRLYRAEEEGDAVSRFVIYYVLFYLAFIVRSDMIEFGRSFVYYCLCPVLLLKLLGRLDYFIVKPRIRCNGN